jgi:hypothetical protein
MPVPSVIQLNGLRPQHPLPAVSLLTSAVQTKTKHQQSLNSAKFNPVPRRGTVFHSYVFTGAA